MSMIDEVLRDFNLSAEDTPNQGRNAITIWVSDDYKKKFERIQDASKKRFGKKLKEIALIAIDKVHGQVVK